MVQVSTAILHVNSASGQDNATGTKDAPLKTIARALQLVRSGATIQLAMGIYDATSGEAFPLVIPIGVTILGDEATQGENILIRGGGNYLSPTFAGQNITLRLETNAQLRGVSVTNPNTRGTGAWAESSAPTIAHCTFTESKREGFLATGTANPIVLDCLFIGNHANGVSITRHAKGEFRRNLFQYTGYGMAISDSAAPLILENHFMENNGGIVISGAARPVLRGNQIERNSDVGLITIQAAAPNLGSRQDPGGNILRDNGEFDLQNATNPVVTISSVGNQVNPSRIHGSVDLLASELPNTLAIFPPVDVSQLPPTALSAHPTPDLFAASNAGDPQAPRSLSSHNLPGTPSTPSTRQPLLKNPLEAESIHPPATPTEMPLAADPGIVFQVEGSLDARTEGTVASGTQSVPESLDRSEVVPDRRDPATALPPPKFYPAAAAAIKFHDVQGHWATTFIQALAERHLMVGFPDGTFRPEQGLTRSQFAALIAKVLSPTARQETTYFPDVSRQEWAYPAIVQAVQLGLLARGADGTFQPSAGLTRAQVLAALAQGFGLIGGNAKILEIYHDRRQIPIALADRVAAATQHQLVVNYPNLTYLQPNQWVTRAEAAAFIYQALVAMRQVPMIASTNIVNPDLGLSAFTDLEHHWASPFILELTRRNLVQGFADGTFEPDTPITREQYAFILNRVFNPLPRREEMTFKDVPNTLASKAAIDRIYRAGFLSAFPDGQFRPQQQMSRLQLVLSLVSGLRMPAGNPKVLMLLDDRHAIPRPCQGLVARALETELLANYPDPRRFQPTQLATRADVAVLIYQALVKTGQMTALDSPYLVAA